MDECGAVRRLKQLFCRHPLIFYLAIELSGTDNQIQYTIRFNDSVLPSEYKPCTISIQTAEYYDRSGYLAVQMALEQALMQHYVESHGLNFVRPKIDGHYSAITSVSADANNLAICFLPSSAAFFMTFAFLSIAIVTTNRKYQAPSAYN